MDDTGVNEVDTPVGGIGAADAVGEKGGCGCTAQAGSTRWTALVLVMLALIKRRRHPEPVEQ